MTQRMRREDGMSTRNSEIRNALFRSAPSAFIRGPLSAFSFPCIPFASSASPLRPLRTAFCLLAVVAAGCTSGPNADLAGPEYPEIKQNQTLDIQVVRDETVIRLTNTTAHAYGPSRLWVNRWYSLAIDKLDVGQTLDLSLWEFKDRYGESFNAGGFFATRKPEKLVLAQIEAGDRLEGLVVVNRGFGTGGEQ